MAIPDVPPQGNKRYQISESDLVELERTLPELMLVNPHTTTSAEKIKWRRVQRIIRDVRWNYGPWDECHRIDAGPDEFQEGEEWKDGTDGNS